LKIRLIFDALNEPESEDLSHYERDGQVAFFIQAELSDNGVTSSLHGERSGNQKFIPFFEASKASEKKSIYEDLAVEFGLPGWTNQTVATEVLRSFESQNSHLNEMIPSESQAFGVEGPLSRLRKFIDFVYITAQKDASDEATEEKNNAFSRLVSLAIKSRVDVDENLKGIRDSTKEALLEVARTHESVLGDLSDRIDTEYRKFSVRVSRLTVEYGDFDSKNLTVNLPSLRMRVSDDLVSNFVEEMGHGAQRNYLMALLLVAASYNFTDEQFLIIACEEPEIYQHPPQARLIADALVKLSNRNAQVLITSHSPLFVRANEFQDIRFVRRIREDRSKVYNWSFGEHRSLIASARQEEPISESATHAALMNFIRPEFCELFFTPFVLFVEGEEDRAILRSL